MPSLKVQGFQGGRTIPALYDSYSRDPILLITADFFPFIIKTSISFVYFFFSFELSWFFTQFYGSKSLISLSGTNDDYTKQYFLAIVISFFFPFLGSVHVLQQSAQYFQVLTRKAYHQKCYRVIASISICNFRPLLQQSPRTVIAFRSRCPPFLEQCVGPSPRMSLGKRLSPRLMLERPELRLQLPSSCWR